MPKSDHLGETMVSPRFPNLKDTYHITEKSQDRLDDKNNITDRDLYNDETPIQNKPSPVQARTQERPTHQNKSSVEVNDFIGGAIDDLKGVKIGSNMLTDQRCTDSMSRIKSV